jgi:NADH:ubiquinone oxidoreductase subunit E
MTQSSTPVREIVMECRKRDEHSGAKGNMLCCALAVQAAVGSVSHGAIAEIARGLDVTEAEVIGVLSFYPDLRMHPAGRHVVRICLGESCFANHAGRVLQALQEELRVDTGGTTANGQVTLERVYCVGNCAVSPTVLVDDEMHGRVTPQDIPYLLETCR